MSTRKPPPSRPASGPAPRAGGRDAHGRRRPAWLVRRVVAGALVLVLGWFSISMGQALTAPGSDSTAARVAEWGREHHLGWAVTTLEQGWYAVHPPATGGTVAGGIPTVHPEGAPRTATASSPGTSGMSLPAPLHPLARAQLAHEGQWQTLLTVQGRPAAQVAFLRPDRAHTSYLADVVWMNPRLLGFELYPGIRYHGQPETGPSHLTSAAVNQVLATFNSGFQLKDSHGGYWQDGKTTQPLVAGAASMVFGVDGSLRIEPWPGGAPGKGVDAVRQNLTMLIQGGTITPQVDHPTHGAWGKTVGNKAYVWRTGIGTRPDGSVVFVLGPALSIHSLAAILRDAGATEAMELDINPAWTDFFTYDHPRRGTAVPNRLGQDTQPAIDRYLKPCSRDFVGVFARGVVPLPDQ